MDIKINYQGMDDNTKNAFHGMQNYIADLEKKLSNINRGINNSIINRYLIYGEQLLITANGNNPPTINAGTIYYTDADHFVYEDTDKTFAWSESDLIPAKTVSTTYYLYCSSIGGGGRGIYGLTTTAPARSYLLNGWYISGLGRAVCRFRVDSSGNVLPGSICNYTSKLVAELLTTTTSAPSITGLNIIKDGCEWFLKMRLLPGAGNAAIFMRAHAGSSSAASDYFCSTDRLYVAASNIGDACIVQNQITSLEAVIIGDIQFIGGRYMYRTQCSGLNANEQLAAIGGDEYDTAKRINITQIDWSLAPGAWVAGSDIRIYRR